MKCISLLPSLISHTFEYQDYGRLIANVAQNFHLSLYPYPCNMTLQLFPGIWVGFYYALPSGMQQKGWNVSSEFRTQRLCAYTH